VTKDKRELMRDRIDNNRNRKIFGKLGSDKGMTMAELLTVVAIIVILAGVAFVAIVTYQRSMAQKERDSIAREIFVAAQNHLTMTRGEGYLGADHKDEDSAAGLGVSDGNGVYHFTVTRGSFKNGNDEDAGFTNTNGSVLDMMLPFASIDETVRVGDSYIIRYEPQTAKVIEVFYCSMSASPARFNHDLSKDDYSEVLELSDIKEGADHKSQRRTYKDNSVLGWYGGEGLDKLPYAIEKPVVEIHNGDRLIAEVTNPNFAVSSYVNDGLQLRLVLTGQESGAKIALPLKRKSVISTGDDDPRQSLYDDDFTPETKTEYILDSITEENMHFADLIHNQAYLGKYFIAGEDIKVEAVAYSSTKLARVTYSNEVITNSLYQSISTPKIIDEPLRDNDRIAYISSFRHLENLDPTISDVGKSGNSTDGGQKLNLTEAMQTENLTWNKDDPDDDRDGVFVNSCSIYGRRTQGAVSTNYYPVDPPSLFTDYDGLGHYIRKVKINYSGNAGLFGTASSKTMNLKLVDFNVTSTDGNAGTLAGTLDGGGAGKTAVLVDNVVAYNTRARSGGYDVTTWGQKSLDSTVEGTGAVGGLVGEFSNGKIIYAAAALVVDGGTQAGGLVGKTSNATIETSYSGGHTQNGRYYFEEDDSVPIYNVRASSGQAGGLVGYAVNTDFKYSYSTCSASGSSANNTGGFVGHISSEGRIEKCYSTGLVSGGLTISDESEPADNAFVGSHSGVVTSIDNQYFDIINEYKITDGSNVKSIGYKEAGIDGVTAFDSTASAYNTFVGASGTWNNAYPYDFDNQERIYRGKYNFMTATQLLRSDVNAYVKKRETFGADRWDSKEANNGTGRYVYVNKHYGDWPWPEVILVNN